MVSAMSNVSSQRPILRNVLIEEKVEERTLRNGDQLDKWPIYSRDSQEYQLYIRASLGGHNRSQPYRIRTEGRETRSKK